MNTEAFSHQHSAFRKDLFKSYSYLIAGCWMLIASQAVWAISPNAGTSNGAFLKIATDARGRALGDGIVALADGADSLHWNPAGLAMEQDKEFSATDVQYFQNVQIQNATFAYPFNNSALAASAFYLNPGSLDGRDSLGNPTGDFQFYDLVGTLGYGIKIFDRRNDGADVLVGGALKVVQEVIASSEYQNPALDLGVLVSPAKNIQIGGTARNLSTSSANFPKEGILSVAYAIPQTMALTLAGGYASDAPIRFSMGSEYYLEQEFHSVVRVGYTTHDSLDDSTDSAIKALRSGSIAGLTLGAGFEYAIPKFERLRLQVDYTMAPFGALGISHYVTVKFKW